MALSPKARLLAHNPSLPPDYLLDPISDPLALSDQFKAIQEDAMVSVNTQRVLDKMMPIVAFFEAGRFVAVAKCDQCPRETRWSAEQMPSPATVFTKIRNRKWQVSKKKITCDHCIKRKKHPVKEFKREPDPPMKPIGEALRAAVDKPNGKQIPACQPIEIQPSTQPAPITTTIAEVETQMSETLAPTDKAKAAKRYAYSLLLEHYDEEHMRYDGDWSDKKIAGLTQLSEVKVAAIRDEDFGPAGPPPQLIDLKQRITQMETRLRERESQVLQAMDEIPQLQQEVEILKSQLQALVSAHGWSA